MGSRQGKSLQQLKNSLLFEIVIILELSEFGPDPEIMESKENLSSMLQNHIELM